MILTLCKSLRMPWLGIKPDALLLVSDADWRTHADTKERLELFAKDMMQTYLIQGHSTDELATSFPQTRCFCLMLKRP